MILLYLERQRMEIAGAITLISQELGLDQIKILGDMEFVGRYGFGGGGSAGDGDTAGGRAFRDDRREKGGNYIPIIPIYRRTGKAA